MRFWPSIQQSPRLHWFIKSMKRMILHLIVHELCVDNEILNSLYTLLVHLTTNFAAPIPAHIIFLPVIVFSHWRGVVHVRIAYNIKTCGTVPVSPCSLSDTTVTLTRYLSAFRECPRRMFERGAEICFWNFSFLLQRWPKTPKVIINLNWTRFFFFNESPS